MSVEKILSSLGSLYATWGSDLAYKGFFFYTTVGLVEEIPEIVKIATKFIPALRSIPLIGKVIPLLSAGEMNETKALEELQRRDERDKQKRTRLKNKYRSKVIKISDAMECVENEVDGKLLLVVGKAILSTITGSSSGNATQILFDKIAACMIEKALQQRNPRALGKFTKTKGPGLPGPEGQESYTEIIKLRRGDLHPFLPTEQPAPREPDFER
jgi:hypothetical protein